MTEYLNIKIPEEKIKSLIKALQKRKINPRTYAEAVNTVIDNFILKVDLESEDLSTNQKKSIKA